MTQATRYGAIPISKLRFRLRDWLRSSSFIVGALRFLNSPALLRNPYSNWRTRLPKELSFWKQWIELQGGDSAESFRQALDPRRPLQPHLAALLEGIAGEEVRILDVGTGPISFVGKVLAGRRITLLPVDPLADEYKRLLDEAGIVPPCPTQAGSAEKLSAQFTPGSFDLVHASNSIDHSFDPVLAITEMVKMVRPKGYVWLTHFRNEGHKNGYYGLHQWNFDIDDGEFIVWNPVRRRSVTSELGHLADIDASLDGEVVNVALRRIP